MSFVDNLALGVCNISYNGVSLGKTKGFVTVDIKQQTTERDRQVGAGNTPVAIYDIGTKITVKAPLAEYTLDNLSVALPSGVYVSDRVKIGGWIGSNEITGYRLSLIPIDTNPAADVPIIVYKAAVKNIEPISFNYNQKIINVTFEGLYDSSRPEGDRLFRIGGPNS